MHPCVIYHRSEKSRLKQRERSSGVPHFFTESEKSIHDLKRSLWIPSLGVNAHWFLCLMAVHVHHQMMASVFCWAWSRDKQVPFLPDHQEWKRKKEVHSATSQSASWGLWLWPPGPIASSGRGLAVSIPELSQPLHHSILFLTPSSAGPSRHLAFLRWFLM